MLPNDSPSLNAEESSQLRGVVLGVAILVNS